MPVEHDPHSGEFVGGGGGSTPAAKEKGEKEYHTIYHAQKGAGGVNGWGQLATTSGGLEKAKATAKSLQNKIANRKGAPTMRIVKGRAAMSNRQKSTAEDPATQHVHEQKGWGENEHGFGDSADLPAETFDDVHADEASPRRVYRRDAGELAKPERTPEGFLRVEGVLARACILHYVQPDGTVHHELVTPEVLFDAASMRSLSGLALTLRHPDRLLTPDTVGAHQVGSIGDPRRNGDELVASLGILRADAIAAVESGECQQLSVGYSADVDDQPGEHPTLKCPQCGTSHFDSSQRDRVGNHTAIVEAARAGDTARIRLDAAGNSLTFDPLHESMPVVATQQTNPETQPMPDIRIDGLTIKADAPDAQEIVNRTLDRIRSDAASLLATERARADKAASDLAAQTKRADGLLARGKAIVATARKRLDAMMKRNVMCDECFGKKAMDDGSKCPSCDGMGMVSARDAMNAMPPPDGEPALEDDMTSMSEEMPEDAMEPAADMPPKSAPKPAMDARKAAQKRHLDKMERIVARRATARAALLDESRAHVDAADLVKPDVEIQRAVLVKIAPHLDAAKLDAVDVIRFYGPEMKRAKSDAAQNGAAPSIALTQGFGGGIPAAPRVDAVSKYTAAHARASRPDLAGKA